MTKTPEQLAEEYATFGTKDEPDSIRKRMIIAKDKMAFLAGYKAGQEHPFQFQTKMWVEPIGPQNQWISVKDRLPESWVHVLIYQFPTTWVSGYCHERKRWGYYESGEPCHPTHWMPLPKPPEDK